MKSYKINLKNVVLFFIMAIFCLQCSRDKAPITGTEPDFAIEISAAVMDALEKYRFYKG
mgnify:CR=1 FL=1